MRRRSGRLRGAMCEGGGQGGESSSTPIRRDCLVDTLREWRERVVELKRQWGILWRDRIDDKIRAEGIANREYLMLDIERGRVIIATRDFKPVDFMEILRQYLPPDIDMGRVVPPSPSVGGWGKFVRTVLSKQKRFSGQRRRTPQAPDRKKDRQLKKGGRGWLHFRMK